MGANDTDVVDVVKTEKRSLLERYDIRVEHLSYEYISECTDGKKMEHIVTILRSGEEGYYPDLTKHAEKRLALLKPSSIILRKSEPILKRNMLEPNTYDEIDKDINNWTSEMQSLEKDLEEGKANLIDPLPQPDIREFTEGIATKPSAVNSKHTNKNKRISSCDYDAWDKYDVDTELNKIDIRDEQQLADSKRFQQKQKEITERKKMEKNTIIDKASLTGTELNVMAEQERKKGNEAFRAGDYDEALEHYNISIKMDSNIAAYNNRAMTYIKLQRYKDALDDCNTVLSTEYKNIKALLRRALSLEHLEKSSQALADYEAVLKLEPTNAVAIEGVKKLRKPSESRKVRMAIQEDTDETLKPNEIDKNKNDNDKLKEKLNFKNSICFCDRAPGPSHDLGLRPHIKADYCLGNERKQAVTTKNKISKKSEIDFRKGVSETIKTLHSSYNENNCSQKKNSPVQTTKMKSIFSCAMPSERTSSVLIEELPKESNEIIESKIVNKCDNKKVDKLNIKDLKRNLKENCNLNGKHNTKWTPTKVQIADKYKNKTSKSEKYVPQDFTNIESAYDFMRVWKSLKNNTDLKVHAQLLRSLNIDKLNTVLGNELDGDMFSTILHCLEQHFCSSNDIEILNKFLKSFSQVKRFSIMNMFMNDEDKQAIKNILNFLEEHGTSEISSLRQIYSI